MVGSAGITVVTGAASGIGLATARLVRQLGGSVVGIDRNPAPEADLARDWIKGDLTDPAMFDLMAEQLAGRPIAHLVLCAGVAGVGSADHVLRINFLAARRSLDRLGPVVRDGGAITVVSSAAGWRWMDRSAALLAIVDDDDEAAAIAQAMALFPDAAVAYNGSKELLCAMVARRCLELWPRGIRLNSVSPGGVETPLIPAFTASMGADAMQFSTRVVGRHATPEEVAQVIAFLGTNNARWVNGSDLRVDGGLVGALSAGSASYPQWVWRQNRGGAGCQW